MTAPDTTESEPTLAEAFSELADALVEDEDTPASADDELTEAPAQPPGDATDAAETTEQGSNTPPPPETQESQSPGREAETQQPGQQPGQQASSPAGVEYKPLQYTVNGETRTFDGGFYIPGQGAVIPNEAFSKLQDRLQQADRLVMQNQQLYQATQEYQKLGGRAAYDKLSAEKAMLDASATVLLRALSDEATLVTLATDPIARQQLLKEIQLTAREAQFTASNQAREIVAREQSQAQLAQLTQTAIWNAVGQEAQRFPGLTAEDIQAVRQQAAKTHVAIVRAATPAEAREANVQVGEPIIDVPILREWLADRHQLRAAAAAQASQRQTDAQENAARVAAAQPTTVVQNGNGRTAPRPGAGKPPAAPAQARKTIDQMSSSELMRAMKSGRIYDMIGEDEENS